MNNNLQMIHENEGEFQNMNEHMPAGSAVDTTQVQQIENEINLIQQQQDTSNKFNSDRMADIEYENDEDKLICGRFPHLDVCACDINCQIALKEINLF